MTDLFEQAVQKIRTLPPDMQDELARMMLQFAGEEQPPIELTPEEEASLMRSREAAARGEFATDEQMRAIWAKHGL